MGEITQTVLVTVVAAGALGVLLRPLMPRRNAAKPAPHGCPSCASGPGCEPVANGPSQAPR